MEEKSRTVDKVVELNQDQHPDAGMLARLPRKGIYLLPNILTTGALFGGFYAVLSGFSGQYEWAAMAIFAAMLFDGLRWSRSAYDQYSK